MVGIIIGQFGFLASPQTDILWLGGVLIAVLITAGGIVLHIRKHWDPRHSGHHTGGNLTLEQIEEMHRAGRISDEEFSVMRRRLLKIPPAKEESKSNLSRSDSIMDDSEEGSPSGPNGPDATENP
jgi:uncharacterized membrane protein